MSRIGKKAVPITDGANVKLNGNDIVVSKGNATLTYAHRAEVTVKVDEEAKEVVVERIDDSRAAKSMHGTTRTLIANMIEGVTKGYKKELQIVGVGWSAQVKGQEVHLNLGYADTRIVPIPMGVTVEVKQQQHIAITGADKQKVGECAAACRSHRKPEPYNGKGVRYLNEVVTRKQGKAFGS
ncbi:50S ribosomal protein L6 [Poriferisphaera corsica]|uniref:50S ribosomal protein L6 n=1 Tax=Poriferisphaera corsica TaxID=2528020 RepID=A0A517YT17_9BACT|nr:50S ribosomal protein L6 [Poriferisphaera corsica]QDU33361.1 50S ribosomal protein L6 [Poriferisphaera corsica]